MSKQPQPAAPNPISTAQAQTASNVDTAKAQAQINAVNQVTPDGSLTYTQDKWPDGTPKFTATTTLSPEQMRLKGINQGTSESLANTAQQQAGRLNTALAQPFSLNNDATEGRLMELGRKRLDPLLAERSASVETDLINRGIRPGSDNYDRAQRNKYNAENDAYNQLLLSGRGQSVSEALAERNQPINESLALASGTQVAQPQFTSTPQTGVGGTDVAGITQADFNNRNSSYQYQQGQQNQLLGGLFGLGANALMFSDKRLKEDIHPTGADIDGVPIKSFRWKATGEPDVGVIAQDVEKKFPHLVEMDKSGYRKVKIGKLMMRAA